jgi:hypothetical protein
LLVVRQRRADGYRELFRHGRGQRLRH